MASGRLLLITKSVTKKLQKEFYEEKKTNITAQLASLKLMFVDILMPVVQASYCSCKPKECTRGGR
jgi:hypothetical protein